MATESVPQPTSASAPLVSIVVVNYNGAQLLQQCLQSLQRLPSLIQFRTPNSALRISSEVIVVENGSSDNSLEILNQFPWVKVIQSQENRGFAGGNNLGLTQCSGEYVLLLNNDTIVAPDFLEPLCDYFEKNRQVGVIQGKMILPRYGNTLDVCGSFLTALGLPYHYGYFKHDGPNYQRSYPVFSGKGACLMFRRDIIERVGGFLFDEDFFCYYEESDFCHRSWLAGYEVHFVPSPPIQHLMGATSGDPQSAFVLRHYLRNMAFSLLSNLSLGSRFRIIPLFFATLFASMTAAALKLQWPKFAAHFGALTWCLRNYGKIRNRRRLIKSIRRQPDAAIFAKALRTPRLDYFVRTLSGRIGQYADDDLKKQ
jgi:GT2 family glycosyltransferase